MPFINLKPLTATAILIGLGTSQAVFAQTELQRVEAKALSASISVGDEFVIETVYTTVQSDSAGSTGIGFTLNYNSNAVEFLRYEEIFSDPTLLVQLQPEVNSEELPPDETVQTRDEDVSTDKVITFSLFGIGTTNFGPPSSQPVSLYRARFRAIGGENANFNVSNGKPADRFDFEGVGTSVGFTAGPLQALSQNYNVNEDGSLTDSLNATGGGAGERIFTIVDQPQNGMLTDIDSSGSFIYRPNPNYFGDDRFTFTVAAGGETSGLGTASVSVIAINDAPEARSASFQTPEDESLPIALQGDDIDGDLLTFQISSPPQNGIISGDSPDFVYTPAAEFFGTDQFGFTVSDGQTVSAEATVTITVTEENDAPMAESLEQVVQEDGEVTFSLIGSDPEGAALQYSIVTEPQNGSFELNGDQLTYTPSTNYNGVDRIEYVANDGAVDSGVAEITITVEAVNDLPEVQPLSITVLEDTTTAVNVSATDIDGDTLQYAVTSGPVHGSLEGELPNALYTPDANYTGDDLIEFSVTDNVGNPVSASVRITVTEENDAPTAESLEQVVQEDGEVTFSLIGSDPEGVALQYSIVTEPQNGSFELNGDQLTYTPSTNYNGVDRIEYVANDGAVDSGVAEITITVEAVNDLPEVQPLSITVLEDTTTAVNVSATDIDVDTLQYAVTSGPMHGSLEGELPNALYTPDANYTGDDLIEFSVTDNVGNPVSASVRITVTAENDAPIAENLEQVVQEDGEVTFSLIGSDPEGVALQYRIVTEPQNGSFELNGDQLTYTPNTNYNGADRIEYVANDGAVDSGVAEITITVEAVNDLPEVQPLSIMVLEDTTTAVNVNATDIDSDTLQYAVTSGPMHGLLEGELPNALYTPDANYTGDDLIEFSVTDNVGNPVSASVRITVTAENDAPIANAFFAMGMEDAALPITLSGSDIETQGGLLFEIVESPEFGVLSGTDANRVYTPDENFFGDDSFSYRVGDGSVFSEPVDVTIRIKAVNDPPIALDGVLSAVRGISTTFNLSSLVSDVEPGNLVISLGTPTAGGMVSVDSLSLAYQSLAGFSGQEQIAYTVTDGEGLSASGVLTAEVADRAIDVAVSAPADLNLEAQSVLTSASLGEVVLTGLDASDFVAVPSASGPFPVGTTQVTWSVFSGDQLLASDIQIVTVVDTVAPAVAAPVAVTIVASGPRVVLNEELLGGLAVGSDVVDNCLFDTSFEPAGPIDSGAYSVTWSIVDCHGNVGTAQQQVTILPTVSLVGGGMVERGTVSSIEIQLTGPAPAYPVTLPLIFAGDAVAGEDYQVQSEEIVIESGISGMLDIQFVSDGDVGFSKRDLLLSVDADAISNAFARDADEAISFEIAAINRPPEAEIALSTDGRQVAAVDAGDMQASLIANVLDPNASDTHRFIWEPSSDQLVVISGLNERELIIDVSGLDNGVYPVRLTVIENGEEALSVETVVDIVVTDLPEALSEQADTNGNDIVDSEEGDFDIDYNGIPAYQDRVAVPNELPQINDDNFFLRSLPGTNLRLGSVSILNGLESGYIASISFDDLREFAAANGIPFEPEFNPSRLVSLVDFEVRGVARGEVASVVIPQTTAIPGGAKYVKFTNEGWSEFSEDGLNQIASAPGALGACPDPESSEYRTGLHEGDFCVRVSIQDGGPNDSDGLDDGVVRDPGGVVGSLESVNVVVESGGGNAAWLVLVLFAFGWRYGPIRRRSCV